MFSSLVCLTLFPALISGNPVQQNDEISARVVGGLPVKIEDFPHQVSLEMNGRPMCGGVIVSESFILTAGHCIFSFDDQNFTIRVNSSLRGTGGNVYAVKNRYLHPTFQILDHLGAYAGIDYDLCILKLEKPLTFGDGIRPIRLPESDEQLPNRTTLTISGWGAFATDDAQEYIYSPVLRAVDVYSYTTEECQKSHQSSLLPFPIPITDRMICGNVPDGGHNSCYADSGGPVTHNGVVYGLVSGGLPCAPKEFPAIYTRVSHPSVRAFIKKMTGI